MQTQSRPATAAGTITLGDMTVNRMGYGAMRITGNGIWGPPKDKAEAIRVLKRSVDLGINFIDTADSYGPHISEELIAEALHPYPSDLIIGTKGGLLRTGPNQWPVDSSPKHLQEALEGSLRRLKLDRIDLYQLHRFDSKVPADETLGFLKEMQQKGLIRHLGVSEVDEQQLQQAQQYFEVVSVQNRYNLLDRVWEGVLDICEQQNIAFLPWYPLSAGVLENETLQGIAQTHNATVHQIALAWLLQHSPVMLPIPGTSTVSHLEENTASATIKLSEEEMQAIESIKNQL
ncbi:aldo/keto reductase [Tellurirhabdus rosea]|uniref:aldo/keto reductase n=1 Tax=Tellurirhabdus rosea TaxID=2674997 RepID=UPI002254F1DC|nr:aldo/keto reductase [Tellurirhabdus rosea]